VKFIENTPRQKIEKYKATCSSYEFAYAVRRATARPWISRSTKENPETRGYACWCQRGRAITELVNIFDSERSRRKWRKFTVSVQGRPHRLSHEEVHLEKWQEDPAFYKRFSQMLEEAIEAFRQRRLSDAEYLKRVTQIMQSVVNRTGDNIPVPLRQLDVARRFMV